MYSKYFKYSVSLLLLYIFIACETAPKEPTNSIQFEIEESNLSEDEKNRAITNIQRRLESLGAENVAVTAQEDQKITFSYRGNIKLKTHEKSFSVAGKLEFFEVCKEKVYLYKYLLRTYQDASNKGLLTSKVPDSEENVTDRLGIQITDNSIDFIFAFVTSENKAKVEKILVEKGSFFVSKLKRRVKFLLGKKNSNNQYELYAVYVDANDKASLDGSYVTNASPQKSNYSNSYVITFEMNAKGAEIWEQVTQKAFETRGNIAVVIDNEVYAAPMVVAGGITNGVVQIEGNFSKEEAAIFATAIRSGSIPKVKILKMESLFSY